MTPIVLVLGAPVARAAGETGIGKKGKKGVVGGPVAIWGHLGSGWAASGFDALPGYAESVPRLIPGFPEVEDVAFCGGVALLEKGKVYTASPNFTGDSGQGIEGFPVVYPTELKFALSDGREIHENAAELGGQGSPIFVRLVGGRVLAMGGNNKGHQGQGDGHLHSYPEFVETADGVPLEKIVQMSIGKSGSLYLDSNKNVWITGFFEHERGITKLFATRLSACFQHPELKLGETLDGHTVEIGGSISVTAARLDDGRVVTWGDNTYGQWGVGTVGMNSNTSIANEEAETPHFPNLGTGRKCVALGVGGYHVIAVLDDGTALAWGRNHVGQCGIGTETENVPTPTKVINVPAEIVGASSHCDDFTGSAFNEVGMQHSFVWTRKGDTYGFGGSREGETATELMTRAVLTPTLVKEFKFSNIFCSEAGGIGIVSTTPAPSQTQTIKLSQGATGNALKVDWAGLPNDRITGWQVEYKRGISAPEFSSSPQRAGNPEIVILEDTKNANAFQVIEFVKFPVQGEGVIYGAGEFGTGQPINDKENQVVGVLTEELEQGEKITLLPMKESFVTIERKVGGKLNEGKVVLEFEEESGTIKKLVCQVPEGTTQTPALVAEQGGLIIQLKTVNFNYPLEWPVESFKQALFKKKTVIKERITVGDPMYAAGKSRWRLNQPVETPIVGSTSVKLGGEVSGKLASTGETLRAEGWTKWNLTPYAPGVFSTEITGLPPTALWPNADSQIAVKVEGLFTGSHPPAKAITAGLPGSGEATVEFEPKASLASDGKEEPGYIFRYKREEPYIKLAAKNGRSAYKNGVKYKKDDWVYMTIEGEPITAWLCEAGAEFESSEGVTEPPFSIRAKNKTGSTTILEVTEGNARLAVGQTILSSSYAGGVTKITANLGTNLWETETAASAAIKTAALMQVRVNATYTTYWKEKPIFFELKAEEEWENFLPKPGGSPWPAKQTATLKLRPHKTGTEKKKYSPQWLEGTKLASVEICGSFGNQHYGTKNIGESRYQEQIAYGRFSAASDVPEREKSPRMINATTLGAVRAKHGEFLEAIPGTWENCLESEILERKFLWAHNWESEDSGAFVELQGPENGGAPSGAKARYEVKESDIGFCIIVIEFVRTAKGWTNQGNASSRSRTILA